MMINGPSFLLFSQGFQSKDRCSYVFYKRYVVPVVREEEEVLTDNETSVTLIVMLDSRHEQDISPF